MNQSDLKSHLETIEEHIRDGNDFSKVNAYRAFQRIFHEENLKSTELKPFLNLISEQFDDSKSPFYNELIKTICLIGQQNLSDIKTFLPKLAKILESEDIFLIIPILKLLVTYSASTNREINDMTTHLLEISTTKYVREDLQESLLNFFEEATNKGFGFLNEYKNKLEDKLPEYKAQMPEIYDLITSQIEKYDKYLILEANRKAQIKVKMEEEQKKREEIRKRRAEIINTLQVEPIMKTNTTEEDAPLKPVNNSQIENPNFISFSKLGLKKKKKS
ncbi:hypothetical protein [Candidatus Harpocratesius sp.]